MMNFLIKLTFSGGESFDIDETGVLREFMISLMPFMGARTRKMLLLVALSRMFDREQLRISSSLGRLRSELDVKMRALSIAAPSVAQVNELEQVFLFFCCPKLHTRKTSLGTAVKLMIWLIPLFCNKCNNDFVSSGDRHLGSR